MSGQIGRVSLGESAEMNVGCDGDVHGVLIEKVVRTVPVRHECWEHAMSRTEDCADHFEMVDPQGLAPC